MTNNPESFYYTIFAIPLLHVKVSNWQEKKKLLLDLCDKETLTFEKVLSVKNSFDMDESASGDLSRSIEEILKDELDVFRNTFGIKQSEVIQSWFQVEDRGMYHPIHNHGYGLFSSVCYMEFDKENHSPTNFVAPAPDVVSGDIMRFVPDDISEGSILFFPSGLPHYSPGNTTEIPRKIISFNIHPVEYLTHS